VVPLLFARWVVDTGCGIVYKLTPNANGSSWTETILYAFFGTSDGAQSLDDRVAVGCQRECLWFGIGSRRPSNFNKTGCAGTLPGGCGVVFEVKP